MYKEKRNVRISSWYILQIQRQSGGGLMFFRQLFLGYRPTHKWLGTWGKHGGCEAPSQIYPWLLAGLCYL